MADIIDIKHKTKLATGMKYIFYSTPKNNIFLLILLMESLSYHFNVYILMKLSEFVYLFVMFTCIVYIYCLYVLFTCIVYLYCLFVLFTCIVYLYCLLVLFICMVYLYCLLVLFACIVYLY